MIKVINENVIRCDNCTLITEDTGLLREDINMYKNIHKPIIEAIIRMKKSKYYRLVNLGTYNFNIIEITIKEIHELCKKDEYFSLKKIEKYLYMGDGKDD